MDWKLELQQSLVTIDERSRSGKERAMVHPVRMRDSCARHFGWSNASNSCVRVEGASCACRMQRCSSWTRRQER
jgi:hypothetical protein